VFRVLAMILLFGSTAPTSAAAAEAWFPLDVDVWTPPFNTERKIQQQRYAALDRVSKKWNICVAIPHLKDAYWLAANYGLIMEARRLDVRMTVFEAGGYDKLDRQRDQIVECMDQAGDALIAGAISADGLNDLVERYTAAGKPVIDLINGIASPAITARAAVDNFHMGQLTGAYLKRLTGDAAGLVKVAWFPGPEGSVWSTAADDGFRASLKGSSATIVATGWGDTGLARQAKLVADAIDAHPDVSYIVGTGAAAEVAIQEVRRRGRESHIKVLSYYLTPAVHRAIVRGSIAFSPSDVPALQARLAVDLAVRALEKQLVVRHLAAPIQVLDAKTLPGVDLSGSLAPEGFRAILSVGR
jgi:protein TorT